MLYCKAHTTTTTNTQPPATVAAAPTVTPAQAPEKKGWSDKAKGAAIGAGAITGALVDKKNRGVGALIDGAAGAAAGLGAGAILDKKKKDKEAETDNN